MKKVYCRGYARVREILVGNLGGLKGGDIDPIFLDWLFIGTYISNLACDITT